MLNGMLAQKIGMTQIFENDGTVVPVTVLQVGPMAVIQKKTEEIDGYDSVQMGFVNIPERKITKPIKGHLKGQAPVRYLKEFKVEDINQVQIGQKFDVSIFEEGEKISVTGTSKGKGFAGVMKRWGFSGQPASHGHRGHRMTGSIGQCTFPGKVFKGKKMHGHQGDEQITTLGLKVVKIIKDNSLLLVKGAVPGKTGGIVTVKKSNR
ncbi:50S ribosomal protein L3 [Deltaproteobacteria bacterium TL4]